MTFVSKTAAVAIIGLAIAAGCRQDMYDQPQKKPLEASELFADGRASRLPVPGTVAREDPPEDDLLHTGRVNGKIAQAFPFEVTMTVMKRGRERYNIYCVPCHGILGRGDGMIVQRGFPAPPSLHTQRLRNKPPGFFFGIITHGGNNVMPPYRYQLPPRDRWAVIAYIRALQRSQNADPDDVPEEARNRLGRSP